ncbi:MAG: methyltransferase domain-containing protein, partial [Desulfocapsa sp.]|nr:methyltransferase domain-containing protein [Desulfocapsa sp.]
MVISSEVVEHIYDPRLYANNISKLLKPSGILLISTPYHGYLKNIALALAGAWDKHFTALWDGGHIKFWSYCTLKELLH